jgi:two-component system sensor histidine kinase DesK
VRRFGWLVAGVWLIYLLQPLQSAWDHGPGPARDVGIAALIAFGAGYLLVFTWARRARRDRRAVPLAQSVAGLAALLALGLLAIPAAGADWMVTLIYVGAAAVLLLPARAALAVVVLFAAVPVFGPLLVPSWQPESSLVVAILLAAFATFGVSRLAERNAELTAAQAEIRRLAVAEERTRTARDLHDILGHSLTVIAVKAELAGRLVEADPARATGEVADLERLAREALADVRATVAAYREVTLATELASAKVALDAAGVEADLPASVRDVPPLTSELFGWAVREGVTNVVRHSGAQKCRIRVGADHIEVLDDGQGPAADGSGGHGLHGLRERAEQMGARLTVGRGVQGRGFRLLVTMPGALS